MGEVPIREDSEDDDRRPTQLLDDFVEFRVDDDRSPMLVVSADAPFTSQDVVLGNEGPAPPESRELELRWAVLAAATVMALVAVILSAIGWLQPSGSSPAAIAGGVLRGLVLVAGSYGTLSLYADTRYLSSTESDWSPSPWPYLVPGGIVVATYLFWELGVTDPTALSAPALVGLLLVAGALSSVPTGPAYLYVRYRRIGLLTE